MANIGALVEELVPLAALHQTDEPLSDSDEEPEPGVSTYTSRSRARSIRNHRNASAKANGKGAMTNSFAHMVAADVPALADVLLEDGDEEAAAFDAFEEEEDAVGTDNDSEEEADNENDCLNTRLIKMPAPLDVSFFSFSVRFRIFFHIFQIKRTVHKINLSFQCVYFCMPILALLSDNSNLTTNKPCKRVSTCINF